MPTSLDPVQIRSQFPGLARQMAGKPAIFADGPAGSQVPIRVAEAISAALLHTNANHGGSFTTSVESDAMLHRVHQDVATFVGTSDPDCIIFGNNMTSLTFAFSRALARTWQPGDEIVLSRCDHDANVTPWVVVAQERNVNVRWIEINAQDCTLNLDSLKHVLNKRTRLVAVGMASNAVGTIHPVRQIADLAHSVGALVFLDAVHYAPHLLIDAPATGADFIACSAYKFFGPHVGILWGKREQLERLSPYKVRPATNELPGRWMTGTQNHEGIAGVGAAIAYLASLAEGGTSLREKLISAYQRIDGHERRLGERFLQRLNTLKGYRLYGQPTMNHRVSTFGITHQRLTTTQLSRQLSDEGIFTWAGNFYALPLTEVLGLEPEGMLRIGFLHYNTLEEVERVVDALRRIGG
ncbi:MAG TPA: cysteine desulfurase-like protein [Gemmatales bacterium]|nr:cysteine desulfurase-like protein [Gemmatales bacterium]